MHPATSAAPILLPYPETWPQRPFGRWWRRHRLRARTLATLGRDLGFAVSSRDLLAFCICAMRNSARAGASTRPRIGASADPPAPDRNQDQLGDRPRDQLTRDRPRAFRAQRDFTRDGPNHDLVGSMQARARRRVTRRPRSARGRQHLRRHAASRANRSQAPRRRPHRRQKPCASSVYSRPFVDSFRQTAFPVQAACSAQRLHHRSLIADIALEGLIAAAMCQGVRTGTPINHRARP